MQYYEDFADDPMMRELHQIREEFARQQEASGLSVVEWLEATEKDMRKSLAEVGFRIVKRGDRMFVYEIKSNFKNKGKLLIPAKAQKKPFVQNALSRIQKPAQPRSYDDIVDSTRSELQLIREDRASLNKTELPSSKKHVKYKTAIKRRSKNSRKK